MNKSIIITGLLAAFALVAFTGKKLHVDVYTVDTKLSVLEWTGEKLTGKHNGTIMFSSGVIRHDHGRHTGSFEFDMTSIATTDIKDEKSKKKGYNLN